MEPKGEITDLKRIERFLEEISQGLAMEFGSIFRIASQYFPNWGIKISGTNRHWIEEQAADSYLKEWKAGTEKSNQAIENATVKANLEIGNERLNAQLGELVVEILRAMHNGKRQFTICDIGSGDGNTIEAVMDAMDRYKETRAIAAYCQFYPIEPSLTRLVAAEQKWKRHALYRLLPGPPMGAFGNHAYHLPKLGEGTFDIVISNAVFHHIPFPEYFGMIRDRLSRDGVMVIGDWHTTIWKHPAFVVPVMEALGADGGRISEFRTFFQIKSDDRERLEKEELTPMQREANKLMLHYVKALSEELAKVGEKLYFLEGHEAFEDRIANIRRYGFETELPALKKGHKGFARVEDNKVNVFEKHDLAAICAVGKIPPPKSRRAEPPGPNPRLKLAA